MSSTFAGLGVSEVAVRALSKRGLHEHAQSLRRSLRGLVERSGFREYYDPFTGQGYGAQHFTWPGLLPWRRAPK